MKYWAYVNNEILGPFEKAKLLELPAFSPSLLVCPQTPVGEKTEDWKEAATYPELSAMISTASTHPSGGLPVTAAPAPSFGEPAAALKPLSASTIDPVPPSEHSNPGINITISHLSRSQMDAASPAASAPHQASPSFDPLTFSQIGRKADGLAAQPAAAEAAPEGMAKEPPQAFKQQSFELETPAGAQQPAFAQAAQEPAAAVPQKAFEPETYAAPAQAAAPAQTPAAAAGGVDISALERKIEELSRAAATKQDLASALDPFRMKLDMMGEVISSIKNSQFQREIMDKLAYLENAVGDIKAGLGSSGASGAKAAAPSLEVKFEKNSDTVFGVQPPPREEKPKAEPAKETQKPAEIVDQGKQKSSAGAAIGKFFKMLFKLVITLALIAAVLAGAVIGLKKFGVFDATKFIPFPIPFLTSPAEPAAAPAADPFAQPQPPAQPEAQPAAQGAAAAPAAAPKAAEKEPQIAPEIVYFVRNYKMRPAGASLEDKIYSESARNGGPSSGLDWKVKAAGKDTYEVQGLIGSAAGQAAYTYSVNFAKKTILPADEGGKAAFEAMITDNKAITVKTPKKGRAKQAARPAAGKQAARPAAAKPAAADAVKKAPAAKKAATSKVAAPEDEYEYVYEEEDGGQ